MPVKANIDFRTPSVIFRVLVVLAILALVLACGTSEKKYGLQKISLVLLKFNGSFPNETSELAIDSANHWKEYWQLLQEFGYKQGAKLQYLFEKDTVVLELLEFEEAVFAYGFLGQSGLESGFSGWVLGSDRVVYQSAGNFVARLQIPAGSLFGRKHLDDFFAAFGEHIQSIPAVYKAFPLADRTTIKPAVQQDLFMGIMDLGPFVIQEYHNRESSWVLGRSLSKISMDAFDSLLLHFPGVRTLDAKMNAVVIQNQLDQIACFHDGDRIAFVQGYLSEKQIIQRLNTLKRMDFLVK
jgi:hypothetical protein